MRLPGAFGRARGPVTASLSLGSNVGDRLETLISAIKALHAQDGIEVTALSGIYETAPWGEVEQDAYLNCCLAVATTLSPRELLHVSQNVEAWHGRDREQEVRWGPRTLDVDVLLFGDQTIDEADLQVPHPRMTERAFVLIPLIEITPGGSMPDGRGLVSLATKLAPIEGIDLHVRLQDVPGVTSLSRPDGPPSPGAYLADEWAARRPDGGGAPPGTER